MRQHARSAPHVPRCLSRYGAATARARRRSGASCRHDVRRAARLLVRLRITATEGTQRTARDEAAPWATRPRWSTPPPRCMRRSHPVPRACCTRLQATARARLVPRRRRCAGVCTFSGARREPSGSAGALYSTWDLKAPPNGCRVWGRSLQRGGGRCVVAVCLYPCTAKVADGAAPVPTRLAGGCPAVAGRPAHRAFFF